MNKGLVYGGHRKDNFHGCTTHTLDLVCIILQLNIFWTIYLLITENLEN